MNFDDVTPKSVEDAARWASFTVVRVLSLCERAERAIRPRENHIEQEIIRPAEELFHDLAGLHEDAALWTALYFAEIECAAEVEPVKAGFGNYAVSLHFALPGFGLDFAGRLASFPRSEEDAAGRGWIRMAAEVRGLAAAVLPVPPDQLKDWSAKRLVTEHRIAVRALVRRGATSAGRPPATATERVPDGPGESPRSFYWKGEQHRLRPTAWKILREIWPDRRVEFLELGPLVWGEEKGRGTIAPAISDLNDQLAEIGVPFDVSGEGEAAWIRR